MSQFIDLLSIPARDMARDLGSREPDFSSHLLSAFSSEQAPAGTRLIKLDSNENPFGPSSRAMDAMRVALASMHAYPDDLCVDLRSKLAVWHDVRPEQVLITAGSTGMLSLLCQTLLGPGLNAVTSALSFILYGMVVRAVGARLIEAPVRDDEFDLDAILNAINRDTRLVLLANPNNPTGTMLDVQTVDSFLAQVPAHAVVVLDEAYYDFAAHLAGLRKVEYSRSLDYVRQDASVVVLRTFSKAHGLAGLRIGYGLGPAELLGYCARMANTYSVSSVAQTAGLAALDDQNHVQRTVSNNAAQAPVLLEGFSKLGYRTVPTAANFVYCDVGEDACDFAKRLREQGVFVRPLNAWGAPKCIRVSIGTPEQNQACLDAIRRVAGKTPPRRARGVTDAERGD
jgi:histidinol-phosphate aminotransferase